MNKGLVLWLEAMVDLFLKKHAVVLLIDWSGLLLDYCDVLSSCLDTYSDGTHSLHC